MSQTTRLDAMARWGLDPARIFVAPHGPGQQPAAGSVRAEYFLYVGDDEPRKNLRLLLDAFARYRQDAGPLALELVLAGRARSDQDGVRCEPDPNLALLLGGAAALVHPALHEGFGLTALEAMSCGVPVIAARSPGLAETCGDAALYIDPYAGAAPLAVALRSLATQPAVRADLARRGRRRAAGFSWQASARAHLAAYELACPQGASR